MANTITIDILADTRKLVQGVDTANRSLSGLQSQVGKLQALGTAAAGIGAGFAGLAKVGGILKTATLQAVETADAISALRELTGKTVIGDKFIKDLGSVNKTLGLSKKEAVEISKSYAVWGNAANLTGKELDAFLRKQLQTTVDVRSFYGGSMEQVQTAIAGAFRGEFEPIRKYGVTLDMATVKQEALRRGLIKSKTSALEPATKVLVINDLLTKQLAITNGDFARTIGSAANQQQILNATLENAQGSLGEALLGPFRTVVTFLNEKFIPVIEKLPAPIKAFLGTVIVLTAIAVPLAAVVAGFIALGTVVAGLGTALATVGLVILAIGALVAIGVLLYKNWDTIKRVAGEVWEGIKNAFEPIATFIKDVFTAAWEGIKPWLQLVVGIVAVILTLFLTPFIKLFQGIAGILRLAFEKAAGPFTWFLGKLREFIGYVGKQWGDFIGRFVGIGANIVKGLWKGISSLGSWLRDKFFQFFGNLIPGWVTKMLGIKSPSKVFIEFGQQIVKGLAIGMNPTGVRRASSGLAMGAMSGFGPAQLSGGGSYGNGMVININAGLGTDPYELGRVVQQALNKYESINGSR